MRNNKHIQALETINNLNNALNRDQKYCQFNGSPIYEFAQIANQNFVNNKPFVNENVDIKRWRSKKAWKMTHPQRFVNDCFLLFKLPNKEGLSNN